MKNKKNVIASEARQSPDDELIASKRLPRFARNDSNE